MEKEILLVMLIMQKLYAISQGVPEDDILTEDQSTVTLENLINAKKIMDVEHYKTALIVSDPLHRKGPCFRQRMQALLPIHHQHNLLDIAQEIPSFNS